MDRNLLNKLRKIDDELRHLGLLAGPLQPAAVVDSAFGMKEMSFEQWLVRVFLPRAYEAAEKDQWPKKSQVAIVAIRNFDGQNEYNHLIHLLIEFDEAIENYGK